VELVSATIFIGGFLLGWKSGLIIGFLTETIYSLLNPYGPPDIPIFIAQIISMSLTGIAGGFIGKIQIKPVLLYPIVFSFSGFSLTLIFDLSTTIAYAWVAHFTGKQLILSLIAGMGFYLMHLLSNTAIFLLIVPGVIRVIKKSGIPILSNQDGRVR
jgi:hypothetical protein